MNQPSPSDHSKYLPFAKKLATYYMDFLQTGFHGSRGPKRRITLRDYQNLLSGILLDKYDGYEEQVHKMLQEGLMGGEYTIAKGKYKTRVPDSFFTATAKVVHTLKAETIDQLLDDVSKEIIAGLHKLQTNKDEEESTSPFSKELLKQVLEEKVEIINQLLSHYISLPLAKKLPRLPGDDATQLGVIAENLSNVLQTLLLGGLIALPKVPATVVALKSTLESSFTREEVCGYILDFFESFRGKGRDLFSDLLELSRTTMLQDKQAFYLYFCDITFDNYSYPLFYIPFTLVRKGQKIMITFEEQLYVNKKAVNFVRSAQAEQHFDAGSNNFDRVYYLADHEENLLPHLQSILLEVAMSLHIEESIALKDPEVKTLKNDGITLSNRLYFALGDPSDEAVINDYEEILQQLGEENSAIAKNFEQLIENFIETNPKVFTNAIEEKWEAQKVSDRLVAHSPIPLNSEQRQILMALSEPDCRCITVEGPPGTGKSHTITAAVFDALLKNEKVLVLSDKKEALDVVEDKMASILNDARKEKNLQNPILRLGKTGNTYSQILSAASLDHMRKHYWSVKKYHPELLKEIEEKENALRNKLEQVFGGYEAIDGDKLAHYMALLNKQDTYADLVDIEEMASTVTAAADLQICRSAFIHCQESLQPSGPIGTLLVAIDKDPATMTTVEEAISTATYLQQLLGIRQKILNVFKAETLHKAAFPHLTKAEYEQLQTLLAKYKKIRRGLGYFTFLVRNQIAEWELSFKKAFPHITWPHPHDHIQALTQLGEALGYGMTLLTAATDMATHPLAASSLSLLYHLLQQKDEAATTLSQELDNLASTATQFSSFKKQYPKTTSQLALLDAQQHTLLKNRSTETAETTWEDLTTFLALRQEFVDRFGEIPLLHFLQEKIALERLIATQMAYNLDKRLVDFYESHRNDAKTLRTLIRKKQKFPKQEFLKLKEAFPCVLSSLRDYADYIPLEAEIFDLIIIDEASQVSIAQALPALLRAKRVFILGDHKQFGNVKATHLRVATNRAYLQELNKTFRHYCSSDRAKLVKLDHFNVQTSILKYTDFISNYHKRLLKHCRGYQEMISFSNKFFYNNDLQVMKLRGKPLEEILKFSVVDPATNSKTKSKKIKNTNLAEVDFIIEQLQALKKAGTLLNVGIITPHTNQQKLLLDKISLLPESSYFFDTLQLKIMTFDTCQGEERDTIFYSMVATPEDDKLWAIFVKNIQQNDQEDNEYPLKLQRLNVGLSRARECMHFVLSKPIEAFKGSIGLALGHYSALREAALALEPTTTGVITDARQQALLGWLSQTDFWQQYYPDHLTIKYEFNLSDYIKSLDPYYTELPYAVNLLLYFTDQSQQVHRIVLLYDALDNRIAESEGVGTYYSTTDLYHYKVMESYGYTLLHLTPFHLGHNPTKVLDELLKVVTKHKNSSHTRQRIQATKNYWQQGQVKPCPKCKQLKRLEAFADASLRSGYGKFCNDCKVKKPAPTAETPALKA